MALLNHVNIFRDVIVVFCSNALAEPCAETLIGGTLVLAFDKKLSVKQMAINIK